MKFNTGASERFHKNNKSFHLIPDGMDVSLCEIGFQRKFFYKQYCRIDNLIPSDKFMTVDEALRSEKTLCSLCFSKLKSIVRNNQIPTFLNFLQKHSGKKPNISEDISGWTETICPNCGKLVGFWNKQKKQEHYCTACNKIVNLPKEIVA
jgi:hypothetical protein